MNELVKGVIEYLLLEIEAEIVALFDKISSSLVDGLLAPGNFKKYFAFFISQDYKEFIGGIGTLIAIILICYELFMILTSPNSKASFYDTFKNALFAFVMLGICYTFYGNVWDFVQPILTQASLLSASSTGNITEINSFNAFVIATKTVLGNSIFCIMLTIIMVVIIMIEYFKFDNWHTVYINGICMDNAFYDMPGQDESGYGIMLNVRGMNLIYNFPDASGSIEVNGLGGHLVAPLAHIHNNANFEGGIIAKCICGDAEGHFYPTQEFETTSEATSSTTEKKTTSEATSSTTEKKTTSEATSSTTEKLTTSEATSSITQRETTSESVTTGTDSTTGTTSELIVIPSETTTHTKDTYSNPSTGDNSSTILYLALGVGAFATVLLLCTVRIKLV